VESSIRSRKTLCDDNQPYTTTKPGRRSRSIFIYIIFIIYIAIKRDENAERRKDMSKRKQDSVVLDCQSKDLAGGDGKSGSGEGRKVSSAGSSGRGSNTFVDEVSKPEGTQSRPKDSSAGKKSTRSSSGTEDEGGGSEEYYTRVIAPIIEEMTAHILGNIFTQVISNY